MAHFGEFSRQPFQSLGGHLVSMKLILSAALVVSLFQMSLMAQDKPANEGGAKSDPAAAEKEAAAKKDDPAKPAPKPAPKNGKTPPSKPQDKRPAATTGKNGSPSTDATVPGAGGEPTSDAPVGRAGTGGAIAAEPAWNIEEIVLQSHGGPTFNRDKISLNPAEGYSFVDVRFRVMARRHDPKAIDNYAKVWKNINRKELTQRSRNGARAFDMRHLALVDNAGGRYPALWNLDEAVRYNIYTAEIQPNSTRQTHQGFWKPNDTSGAPMKWLDSEQSFITRTIRPPNRPAIVEQVTYFSGILEVDKAVDVNFLFGIPNAVDRDTLSLVYDSLPFQLKQTTTP